MRREVRSMGEETYFELSKLRHFGEERRGF
jgi:hypothetical protein